MAKPIGKKTGKQFQKTGVDDLVMLPKIGEDSILENLKKRYTNGLIYTNIGPVLIAINPFKDLGITGLEYIELYKGRFRHELDPHIYALAEETYRAMKGEGFNQCVIISGESGAGKTESAKLVMKYISAVSGNSAGVEYVKHVILESNPLLEAFGNAKTLRNNNSSRFGKYFEIHFNAAGDPCGGSITNYLLEKSRVVFQTKGERNFHIFYQLLAGASNAEANNFTYLNQSECYAVDGMNDAEEYGFVRSAMNTIGISANDQNNVFKLVAAILHLGNVYFQENEKGDAVIADSQQLDLASSLLNIEQITLKKAILQRVINTGQSGGRMSTYNVPQNIEQATYARDAIGKAIYSRIFDWLIQKVNEALARDNMPHKYVIGVLDIFGFEIFEHNGFEQFCINYVNEKLQQFFIELTLKAEQEEYQNEGIKWEPIKYFNNQIVCELIEGKAPPGIFSVLDDVCYTIHAQSKGTDEKFLQKLHGSFPSHAHFRGFDATFEIKHYAGNVPYDVDGFCDKNKDTLFNDIIQTLQSSSNPYLVMLFPEDTNDTASNRKRPTTAGFKIKNSAQKLMTTLSACEPHYIRCIKPNETKQPLDWDHPRVKHQVQYLGLLENVRVRRAGFAYRAEFHRFLKRYKKLSKKTWSIRGEWGGAPQEGCTVLLQDLQIEAGQWQLGKTKVFIRHPETLFHIEELLERHDYDCTLKIQRAWKKWKARKHALEQRAAAADLLRGKKERQRDSVGRNFDGDYVRYEDNYAMQEMVTQGEIAVFADQIIKLNRRSKPERRDFVMTNKALYFIMRKKKKQQMVYTLSRRTEISQISSVSLSTMSDNYIIVHCNAEYDNLFENERKTEIAMKLLENYKILTSRELTVNFNDNLSYKTKTKDTRNVRFVSSPGAAVPQLKKAGKSLTVMIAPGLPKDTDTKPKNFANRGANKAVYTPPSASSSSNSGGGGGGGGGYGAPPSRGGPTPSWGGSVPPSRGGGFGAPPGGRGAPFASPPAAAVTQEPPAGRGGVAPPSGGAVRGGARGGARGSVRGASVGGGIPGPSAGRGGPAGGRGAAPPPKAAQPPPRGPPKPQVRALFPYKATSDDELTFNEGDIITILKKDQAGWWEGEINGRKGYIPANYIEEI